jgi:hypothetical protein
LLLRCTTAVRFLNQWPAGELSLRPLLRTMRDLQLEMGGELQFVIVSDFEFSNGSENDLVASGLNFKTIKL